MSKSKKLIFFGNERLATSVSTTAPTLRALIATGYEIEAVIANHEDPISRQKRGLEIGSLAHSHGIPVILPGKDIPLLTKLKNHQAEAAVLVAFGKIIPKEVIDFFPKGIINIHPSLLPKYRGPTPIESAILDGVKETGASLMKLDVKMDTGPIYAQRRLKLLGNETKQELSDKLLSLGAELLISELPQILDGSKKPVSQNDKVATYTKLIQKDYGQVDFQKPALLLEREVRAYAGWPQSLARIFGHDIIITKTQVVTSKTDGALVVACQPGWLEIQELKAPSGKTMSGSEFLRGYSKRS